jgi:Ca-activated chloride channel family protein
MNMPILPGIQFASPWALWLLALVPAILFWYWKTHSARKPALVFSSLGGFEGRRRGFRERTIHLPFILRVLLITLLILALARPQSTSHGRDVTTEGIDIMMALDISGSMLAEDFKPNRIEAAKKVARNFISSRPGDRIGLVVFSGESFTQCPLTTDHSVLHNLMGSIESGMLEDGTAIGMGLATAVLRLKTSEAKSKVIILLTDGVNNAGQMPPLTAAELAKAYGIRVYTIGVGTRGTAPYPFKTPYGIQYQNMEVQIDEAAMKQIASSTGGKYFRATDNKKLEEVYREIDQLEKTRIEVTEYSRHAEEFLPLALLAGLLGAVEVLLRYAVYRSVP